MLIIISIYNSMFQNFILRRFGLLTVWATFTSFTSNKGWRIVELQPKVLCFLSLYPVATFLLIHCSYISRILELSTNGWQRMVELLPRLLCLLSQLTWISISRCISSSNLLFQSFVWRNVARMVNRFGLLTVEANFLTSYLW